MAMHGSLAMQKSVVTQKLQAIQTIFFSRISKVIGDISLGLEVTTSGKLDASMEQEKN